MLVAGSGVVLADWASLARNPALAAQFAHVVVIDPPPFAHLERLCRLGAGFLHRVDGDAEREFALRVHADEWPSRSSLADLYRALGAAGTDGIDLELLRRIVCGDGRTHPAFRRVQRPNGARSERAGARALGRIRPKSDPRRRILRRDGSGEFTGIRRIPWAVRGGSAIPDRAKTDLERNESATAALVRRGHIQVGAAETAGPAAPINEVTKNLDADERALLGDLFAVIGEHTANGNEEIDRDAIERAFAFACERHADQKRKSGEDFITHPVEVAKICAGLRLDTETLCAALLHDTVEDTSASLDEVREKFGDSVAALVDGVTKLTGITFQSRDEHQAENYRKMMVAMATDVRVILIKLADRLHNMRTLEALNKQKQMEKARETLEIYAPLAHRLGIHAIKWELEDLSFQRLHPRKYEEIKKLVAQQRVEREDYVSEAGEFLAGELAKVGIEAQISGRAKHFYSIYSKMTKKGREFNEIYDLTAMRVIVDSVKDCYGAIGIIHSLWKPLPGRFKDLIATPKLNLYQALHTTVIGPEGRPLEIQIRTPDMHETAEYGIAAHVIYKEGASKGATERDKMTWLRQLLETDGEEDPAEFLRGAQGRPLRGRGLRLHAAGRGQEPLRGLDPARLRVLGPHRHRPPLRRRQGQRQDRAAALHAAKRRHRRDPHLQAGARPVTRLACARAHEPRPQQDPRIAQARAPRGRRAPRPRGAADRAAQERPASAEDRRFADARGRHP